MKFTEWLEDCDKIVAGLQNKQGQYYKAIDKPYNLDPKEKEQFRTLDFWLNDNKGQNLRTSIWNSWNNQPEVEVLSTWNNGEWMLIRLLHIDTVTLVNDLPCWRVPNVRNPENYSEDPNEDLTKYDDWLRSANILECCEITIVWFEEPATQVHLDEPRNDFHYDRQERSSNSWNCYRVREDFMIRKLIEYLEDPECHGAHLEISFWSVDFHCSPIIFGNHPKECNDPLSLLPSAVQQKFSRAIEISNISTDIETILLNKISNQGETHVTN